MDDVRKLSMNTSDPILQFEGVAIESNPLYEQCRSQYDKNRNFNRFFYTIHFFGI